MRAARSALFVLTPQRDARARAFLFYSKVYKRISIFRQSLLISFIPPTGAALSLSRYTFPAVLHPSPLSLFSLISVSMFVSAKVHSTFAVVSSVRNSLVSTLPRLFARALEEIRPPSAVAEAEGEVPSMLRRIPC